jgi:single-strand DNA-binding protein
MTTIKNHVTLVGNIGTSAQITNFDNGNKVARFSLTTDKSIRTNSGKTKKIAEWHKLFAWGNMAKFIENYAEKGKKVAIHGRLVYRTYLNKEGVKRNVAEVEVRNIMGL